MTASNYASSYVQIFPAMKTGRVQVLANAMARELITDETGKVTAVSYIDKTNGTEQQVRCRTVVLSASACESSRLLLNSKSPRHPQGLANSSGMVGRYLMDTVGSSLSASVPALSGMPHYNSDGYGSHLYVPWWGWDKQQALGFPRGYHIEVGGGYGMPGIGSFTGIVNRTEGYGVKMKQAIRDEYGTTIGLSGRGEMIPNEKSFCEIDPEVKDRWGIPGAALPLGVERSRAESGAAHAEDLPRHPRGDGRTGQRRRRARRRRGGPARIPTAPPISRGGAIIHEVGTVRMGDDPKTSPLNKFLPGARGEEPLRRRRRAVCQQSRQEPDAHHHRAGVAHGRVPRRRIEEGQCLRSHGATRCGGWRWR